MEATGRERCRSEGPLCVNFGDFGPVLEHFGILVEPGTAADAGSCCSACVWTQCIRETILQMSGALVGDQLWVGEAWWD